MSTLSFVASQLRPAFDHALSCEKDCLLVANTENSSIKTIEKLITKHHFCPLFSTSNPNNSLFFTVVPFVIPKFFYENEIYKVTNLGLRQYRSLFPTAHKNHFKKIKYEILSHSQGLNGSALILGYGNGNDIPLKKLSKIFNEITLVDYDLAAMQDAVASLPQSIQSKITLVKQDLTCLVDFFEQRIALLNPTLPLSENLENLSQLTAKMLLVENSVRFISKFSKQYNFVCSSMLTSQLYSILILKLESDLRRHYPALSDIIHHPNFSYGATRLSCLISHNHIETLFGSTLNRGHILYLDHTTIDVLLDDKFESTTPTIPTEPGPFD